MTREPTSPPASAATSAQRAVSGLSPAPSASTKASIPTASVDRFLHFGIRGFEITLAVHVCFLFLFAWLHVWPLAIANIGSVTLYTWCIRVAAHRYPHLLLPALWSEITGHALLSVWVLGVDAGFQFYVLALLPIAFINVHRYLLFKCLQASFLIAFFLACDGFLEGVTPLMPLDPRISHVLRHFNIVGGLVVMAGISYLNASSVLAAERALQHLASTDALTGLLNRRTMEELIQQETTRADRYTHDISLVLLDVDHFKSINDDYSHAAGDEVLQNIALRLRSALRTQDLLARWGGEEFLVMLPETGAVAAHAAAERLRLAIAETSIGTQYGALSCTITLGVCSIRAGETLHQALARADVALYQGKATGRNRTETAA